MSNANNAATGSPSRARVLFVSEAVTLAHAARPAVLAGALDQAEYDVHLAWDGRFAQLFSQLPGPVSPLRSITTQRFVAALAKGTPIYDVATLEDYVEQDLRLIEQIGPDAVVGDFRLSLAVSAPLAGVPYLAISNAYWSPYLDQRMPLPDLPLNRVLGLGISQALFRTALPVAFALHARPLNRVRRRHGLPSLGSDLRRVYTWADHTLYADPEALYPELRLPQHHHFVGAVAWEPAVALPDWWAHLPADRPILYVNLGSSGPVGLLSRVLAGLARMDVTVIAATAGRPLPTEVPANVYVSEYLPGELAAGKARLMVCNGGSPATQQALRAGIPVLALPSNLDQYLNMAQLERFGAGRALRAERAKPDVLRRNAAALLDDPGYARAAGRLSAACAPGIAPERFRSILAAAIGR